MLQNSYVCLMAEYNQWMNLKLYDACSQLSDEQLSENRGAFFGSIIGTLNHLAVADTIWLKRMSTDLSHHRELSSLSQLSMPQALNTILYSKLKDLAEYRLYLDNLFLSLSKVVTDSELQQTITYKNTKGIEFKKVLFSLLVHVFNHQTHHRGQTTTLLSQAGVDVGVTDLLAIIPGE
ncbi:DinB family protein [Idiomarina sp.]|uniref:DinB family protein n=1 Tax=Idiomarina sp. TaxID=1874361 RepID=UPI003A909F8F